MFKKLKRRLLYHDAWMKAYQDELEFPDKSTGTYAWVDRKPGIVVAVLNLENQILLNSEYRYVIADYDWEIPGGGIDEGETPEEAAIREVKEECGINIANLEHLGQFYPLNSFSRETIDVYLGRTNSNDLTSVSNESSELIVSQKYISMTEALEMIDNGEICDVMTANVIQMVARKLSL